MGHGKHKGYSFRKEPRVPIADYNVTGELTPDATCNYFEAGVHNIKPYYRRDDVAFFIWWDSGISKWIISSELGVAGAASWARDNADPIGLYTPKGEAVGDATVSAGAH